MHGYVPMAADDWSGARYGSCEGGDAEREEETRRLGREELEARVGRGLYVAGAAWDEGNMVHAMRRFGGQTIGWRFGDG